MGVYRFKPLNPTLQLNQHFGGARGRDCPLIAPVATPLLAGAAASHRAATTLTSASPEADG